MVSDQNIDAFVVVDEAGKPVGTIEDGDAVVLFNFRADRMVEISKAFEYPDFKVQACAQNSSGLSASHAHSLHVAS